MGWQTSSTPDTVKFGVGSGANLLLLHAPLQNQKQAHREKTPRQQSLSYVGGCVSIALCDDLNAVYR